MTLFRTGLLSGGVVFFSGTAGVQQNVGAAGKIVIVTLQNQMPRPAGRWRAIASNWPERARPLRAATLRDFSRAADAGCGCTRPLRLFKALRRRFSLEYYGAAGSDTRRAKPAVTMPLLMTVSQV